MHGIPPAAFDQYADSDCNLVLDEQVKQGEQVNTWSVDKRCVEGERERSGRVLLRAVTASNLRL